jgi:hypothetical protein
MTIISNIGTSTQAVFSVADLAIDVAVSERGRVVFGQLMRTVCYRRLSCLVGFAASV